MFSDIIVILFNNLQSFAIQTSITLIITKGQIEYFVVRDEVKKMTDNSRAPQYRIDTKDCTRKVQTYFDILG